MRSPTNSSPSDSIAEPTSLPAIAPRQSEREAHELNVASIAALNERPASHRDALPTIPEWMDSLAEQGHDLRKGKFQILPPGVTPTNTELSQAPSLRWPEGRPPYATKETTAEDTRRMLKEDLTKRKIW